MFLRVREKSVCAGEGPINVAGGQNRGQEVRVNGPLGAPGQMRMDVGFPMQQGPGSYIKHPSGIYFSLSNHC